MRYHVRTMRNVALLVGALLLLTWCLSAPALATVGWETGDIVLDFGVTVDPGESAVLVDKTEVGKPFFVEVTWKLNAENCFLQVQRSSGKNVFVEDDGLFEGRPGHAKFRQVEVLSLHAKAGKTCEIDAAKDEFVTVAREPRGENEPNGSINPAPIGAVVMVFRATAFFVPENVTVKAGEKIVWIYADGAKEPHSVTSGACRVNDCSGGGQEFNSGPTLTKPGHRFEHVFTQPGTYPYHCDLHLGSMQGTVMVEP